MIPDPTVPFGLRRSTRTRITASGRKAIPWVRVPDVGKAERRARAANPDLQDPFARALQMALRRTPPARRKVPAPPPPAREQSGPAALVRNRIFWVVACLAVVGVLAIGTAIRPDNPGARQWAPAFDSVRTKPPAPWIGKVVKRRRDRSN